MLNFIFRIFIIYLTLQTNFAYSSSQNKIIANIENQILTSYELENKIKIILFLSNQELNQNSINMTKNLAINNLVNYKLKKEEVLKFNIAADQRALDNYLRNLYSKYQTDSLGFEKIFKNHDLNLELYLDEIKTEVAWQALIFKLYNNKIDIDDNEVNKELNEIIKDQKNIEELKLAEIEILLENNSKDNDKLKELTKQIKLVGFKNAAIKFSISSSAINGGEIGWVNLQSLSNNVKNLIKEMKPGETSKPLIQSNSAMIFKLLDKRKLNFNNVDVEKIRKKIINRMKNELFNLYSNSHLSKLKNDAFIKFKN